MSFSIGETCVGCTACARQCPTGAIEGEPDRVHRIRAEACIDCGVCGLVCPVPECVTDDGGSFVRYLARSQRPVPVIDVEACNGCAQCVDRCPFGCLDIVGARFDGWAVLAAPDICVSCMDCQSACSKGAIHPVTRTERTRNPT